MTSAGNRNLTQMGSWILPFADAASAELPLGRLLRLALFQVSVGMAVVLLNGTLNRVMIVELGVPAWLVATMVAIPLLVAPFRALIGFRSDTHRSKLGWRRVPYIWFGTLLQFGGLAIMPFALLLLSGASDAPHWVGYTGAALAFLLTGAGLHTTQTAGLALATDLAPEASRPRVVALLYVMLLLGMGVSALTFSVLLADFGATRLVEVVQGAAVVTVFLNVLALWKQEPRNRAVTRADIPRPDFRSAWRGFLAQGRSARFLWVVGLGTAGFSMQDILLEPYGGQVMGLSVGATTLLTALLAGGTLVGLAVAARRLTRGDDPYRLAAGGVLVGIAAFCAVVFAAPLDSPLLFRLGTTLIGFGGGLFAVGTLTVAMHLAAGLSRSLLPPVAGANQDGAARLAHGLALSGMALGAWGAVQATAMGLSIAFGGALRDIVALLAGSGQLGPGLTGPATGYMFVYHLEILLLFATLVAVGPLVGTSRPTTAEASSKFGLAEFPS